MGDGHERCGARGDASGAGAEEVDVVWEPAQSRQWILLLARSEEELGADVLRPLAGEDVVAVGDERVVGVEVQDLDPLLATPVAFVAGLGQL